MSNTIAVRKIQLRRHLRFLGGIKHKTNFEMVRVLYFFLAPIFKFSSYGSTLIIKEKVTIVGENDYQKFQSKKIFTCNKFLLLTSGPFNNMEKKKKKRKN